MAQVVLPPLSVDFFKYIENVEIPARLRCASCSKIAMNAFRLPCCDQAICEDCHSLVSHSCPMCDHSPISADDCKQHRTLRLTLQSWIKSTEKKREREAGTNAAAAAVAPVALSGAPAPATAELSREKYAEPQPAVIQDNQTPTRDSEAAEAPAAEDQAIPTVEKDAVEDAEDAGEEETDDDDASSSSSVEIKVDADDSPRMQRMEPHLAQNGTTLNQYNGGQGTNGDEAWNSKGDQVQSQMNGGGGFGFDPSQTAFGGMDWTAMNNFNPMMNMQVPMQNGMPNSNWGSFSNMMGMYNQNKRHPALKPPLNYQQLLSAMPNMMDPMAMSQGMFGGYGMQGMGNMNGVAGMNAGMGYGGNNYGGWNGQQMSNGFGSANAGYYPNGGYNQQSHQGQFPQMQHQHPRFQKNNYQNRYQGHSGAQAQRGYGPGSQGNTGMQFGQNQNMGQVQVPILSQTQGGAGEVPKKEEDAFFHQLPTGLQDQRPSQQKSVDAQSQNCESRSVSRPQSKQGESQASGDVTDRPDAVTNGSAEPKLDADSTYPEQKKDIYKLNIANEAGDSSTVTETPQQDTHSNGITDTVQPIATIESVDYRNEGYLDHTSASAPMVDPMSYGGPVDHYYNTPIDARVSPHGRDDTRNGISRADYQFRGGFGGRGVRGFNSQNGSFGSGMSSSNPQPGDFPPVAPIAPKGVGVQGAPTGPKAMREGHNNASFRGRGGFPQAPGRSSGNPLTPDVNIHPMSTKPEKRKSRSPSRSLSRSGPRTRSQSPEQSTRHLQHRQHRSQSPSTNSESQERYRERKRRRSERKYEDEQYNNVEDIALVEGKEGTHEEQTRDSSVASRHRSSRYDRSEKHRSLRSHRDRESSRERRRNRHRSRSRSPARDGDGELDDAVTNEQLSRSSETDGRRSKHDKYREREDEKRRKRHREHERGSDEREKDGGKSRGARDRDSDHRKKSHREREASPREYSDTERKHKSSRRSRKEKDRDRESVRDDRKAAAEEETEFKIQGRSREKNIVPTGPAVGGTFQPPTGPKGLKMQPPAKPKGRHRDRDRARSSSISVTASTPSTPVIAADPHTLEREARNRERMLKEQQRRATLEGKGVGRKRSFADDGERGTFDPPKGPSAERRVSGKKRRVSCRYEDEENEEGMLRQMEREREAERFR